MRREQQSEPRRNYVARTGNVRQLAAPDPTAIGDVIGYLMDCDLEVYFIRGKGTEAKYMFQGLVVTLRELESIANTRRSKQRLPPFRVFKRLH